MTIIRKIFLSVFIFIFPLSGHLFADTLEDLNLETLISFSNYSRVSLDYLYGASYDYFVVKDTVPAKGDGDIDSITTPNDGYIYESSDAGQGFSLGIGFGGDLIFNVLGHKINYIGLGLSAHYKYIHTYSEGPLQSISPGIRMKVLFLEMIIGPDFLLNNRSAKRLDYYTTVNGEDTPVFKKERLDQIALNIHMFVDLPVNKKLRPRIGLNFTEFYFSESNSLEDRWEWIGLSFGLAYYL